MSNRNYMPGTDAGVVAFTFNWGRIVAENPTHYGFTEAAITAYNTKQQVFAARVIEATEPTTRGKRTVFLKNESKKELVALTRKYCQQVSKLLAVTDAEKQALGITIPSTNRQPIPAPTTKPFVLVTNVDGRNVTIELRKDQNTRGKPAKVASATVLYKFAGSEEWVFGLNTKRTTDTIAFPPSDTGDTVQVTAFWNNNRDESGPAATPVTINLPAGEALPRIAELPKLKAA